MNCVHRQAEPVTLTSGEQVACICIECFQQLPADYITGQMLRAELEAYCAHFETIEFTKFGDSCRSYQCLHCGAWQYGPQYV